MISLQRVITQFISEMPLIRFIPFLLFLGTYNYGLGQNTWKKYTDEADSLRRSELYGESIPLYLYALRSIDANSEEYLKYKIRLGLSYFFTKEQDLALKCYESVIQKTENDTINIYRAHAYNNMGLLYDNTGMFKKSFMNYTKAQSLYTVLGDSLMSDVTLMNIGIIRKKQGELLPAIEMITGAASGFEKRKDHFQLAEAYSSIGGIQELLGDRSKALFFYNKALLIRIRQKDKSGIASIYNNIGGLYMQKEELDSAIIYFNKALFLMNESSSLNKGIALQNLAFCYAKVDPPQARILYQRALDFKTFIGDINEIVITQNEFANFEIENKNLTRAFSILKKSRDYVNESNNKRVKRDNFLVWKEYYKKTRALDSAIYYFELARQLDYELRNEVYLKELALLQESFELESKDHTIDTLKKHTVQQNKELNNLNGVVSNLKENLSVIVTISIILIGVLLFVFYYQKQRMENQKLKSKLKGIEQEKKRTSMELHDAVGSKIKSLVFKLENKISSGEKEIPPKEMVSLINQVKTINKELLDISRSLYFPELNDLVFSELIEDLLYDAFEESKTKIQFHNSEENTFNSLKTETKGHIFRCIQEIVINTNQHAKAENILFEVFRRKTFIFISIQDDGVGIELKKSKGIGLKNLSERLTLISGEISISNALNNKGTIILMKIPIKENTNGYKQD